MVVLCCAEAADTDLDRELIQHKQAQAATVAASTNSVVQRIRRFLKPPREELEAMPFGQRMQYEMVNSFLQVGGWGNPDGIGLMVVLLLSWRHLLCS
jgi:hypothetical protein